MTVSYDPYADLESLLEENSSEASTAPEDLVAEINRASKKPQCRSYGYSDPWKVTPGPALILPHPYAHVRDPYVDVRGLSLSTTTCPTEEENSSEASTPKETHCASEKHQRPNFGSSDPWKVTRTVTPAPASAHDPYLGVHDPDQVLDMQGFITSITAAFNTGTTSTWPTKEDFSQGHMEPNGSLTTLMIRGIPCSRTEEDMLELIHANGFEGRYDFFYLPRSRRNLPASKKFSNLGYAFANFPNPDDCVKCMAALNGLVLDTKMRSTKVCEVVYARLQGLDELISHFGRRCRRKATTIGQPRFFNLFPEPLVDSTQPNLTKRDLGSTDEPEWSFENMFYDECNDDIDFTRHTL